MQRLFGALRFVCTRGGQRKEYAERLGVQLGLQAVLSAGCSIACHAPLDRGLRVVGPTPVFSQDTTPLKLFLEAAQGAVNCFIRLNSNSNHAANHSRW